MTTLSIRNLSNPDQTALLVRDVNHYHPDWVHIQLGTSYESELQHFLDGIHEDEFAENVGQPDASGVFMAIDDAVGYLASIGADKLGQDEAPIVKALLKAGKTPEDLAAAIGGEVIDGYLIPEPGKIWANDGNAEIEYEDMTRAEATQDYVDGGEWGEGGGWVDVSTYRYGFDADGDWGKCDRESHTIELEQEIPPCEDGQEHDWQSPLEIVGGIAENPGVWGHGGGVIAVECCMHCGCKRTTDTWAQNPATGEQGLTSVSYEAGYFAEELAALREDSE
jgi:hypothetical protein